MITEDELIDEKMKVMEELKVILTERPIKDTIFKRVNSKLDDLLLLERNPEEYFKQKENG